MVRSKSPARSGYFAKIDPASNELDDIVGLVDNAGQAIKRNMAATTLEKADQRAAQLAHDLAPHLRKYGKRPFSIIAPYTITVKDCEKIHNHFATKAFCP